MKQRSNAELRYHKWRARDAKKLFQSANELLKLKSLQFYMPCFSLYFYVHNKKHSTQRIDLERNFYLKKINEITKERYYNTNMFLKGVVYDSSKDESFDTELFCKTIPLVDPMQCINDNYNFVTKTNFHLPSTYNYNTFSKINDMNNTAYIDVFCSFLFGQLTYKKLNPSFPLYYGAMNGIGNYKYDISEEYDDIKVDKIFNETVGKAFEIDMYVSDSDSESEKSEDNNDDKSDSEDSIESIPRSFSSFGSIQSYHSDKSEQSKKSDKSAKSDKSDKSSDYGDDYVAIIKDIPLQQLYIEKLEGTLEDLLDEKIEEEVLLSCFFQISFALTYLQKHYQFTHNDLHINNVMYTETTTKYLYYKYNNIYYRVPTHGKIFKIIDYGRAIFTYKNKVFLNDVFSKHGEAGGQYNYPSQVRFLKLTNKENNPQPNYHFDLCRLSMTILEELQSDDYSEETLDFLKKLCLNHKNESFCEMRDDFKLYISIAKDACNCLPREVIVNSVFKKYRVKKSVFPRKSFYTL
tara:strand:- start:27 stop:1586 length:1560 start_codon:yes stop_codon:yes gene_type:complete